MAASLAPVDMMTGGAGGKYAPVPQDDRRIDGKDREAPHVTIVTGASEGGGREAPRTAMARDSRAIAAASLFILVGAGVLMAQHKCDAVIYFVGGFHHSGTTVMQHELLRRTRPNRTVTARAAETWPPRFPFACPTDDAVFKHPTNDLSSVTRMLRLRDRYPNVRLVFMQRDIPNTVWSLYKRAYNTKRQHTLSHGFTDFANEQRQLVCQLRAAWARHTPFSGLDHCWTVDLHAFTERTDAIMGPILAKGAGGRRRSRLLPQLPASRHHTTRRWWQAVAPVYPDDAALFRRETSAAVAQWLESNMHCGDADDERDRES